MYDTPHVFWRFLQIFQTVARKTGENMHQYHTYCTHWRLAEPKMYSAVFCEIAFVCAPVPPSNTHLITCTNCISRVELQYSYAPLLFCASHTDCPVTIAPTNDFLFYECVEQSSMHLHTAAVLIVPGGRINTRSKEKRDISTPRKIACDARTA